MSVSRTCLGSPNFIDGASLATVSAYRASCSPVGIAPILFSITSVSRPGPEQNTRSKPLALDKRFLPIRADRVEAERVPHGSGLGGLMEGKPVEHVRVEQLHAGRRELKKWQTGKSVNRTAPGIARRHCLLRRLRFKDRQHSVAQLMGRCNDPKCRGARSARGARGEPHRGLRPPGWQELLMPDEMTQQGIRPSGTSPPRESIRLWYRRLTRRKSAER